MAYIAIQRLYSCEGNVCWFGQIVSNFINVFSSQPLYKKFLFSHLNAYSIARGRSRSLLPHIPWEHAKHIAGFVIVSLRRFILCSSYPTARQSSGLICPVLFRSSRDKTRLSSCLIRLVFVLPLLDSSVTVHFIIWPRLCAEGLSTRFAPSDTDTAQTHTTRRRAGRCFLAVFWTGPRWQHYRELPQCDVVEYHKLK